MWCEGCKNAKERLRGGQMGWDGMGWGWDRRAAGRAAFKTLFKCGSSEGRNSMLGRGVSERGTPPGAADSVKVI